MSNTASDITRLRAALAASQARAEAAESELAQVRAVVSTEQAMIKHLKPEITELRRENYGHSSERRVRLIDQMELQLEELEAAATEDAIDALNMAKTKAVASFGRRRPARKPLLFRCNKLKPVVEKAPTFDGVKKDEQLWPQSYSLLASRRSSTDSKPKNVVGKDRASLR